jgi:signal transduction histidine kinase
MSDSPVIILIIVSMIIMVVISLSVLWFFYYTQNKTIQLKMKEQANQLQYQKNLLLNTVKTQENERNRISAELHDDLGSRLNVIHLNLHLLKTKAHHNPEISQFIDQIETSLDEGIRRTRVISHELMPPLLRKFGFHNALNELAGSLNATGKIRIIVTDDHVCRMDDSFRQLHLYRIIQELINNTIKYARATEIKISFSAEENETMVSMEYSDNGTGFDTGKVIPGLGLSNIKTRTELLNGRDKIVSLPEKEGFYFTLKFPLNG